MKKFGARKLVVINSGKYEFAEIDLSKPVHLAARNNSGKSTLVNSLQFLYIDRLESMYFGRRSHTDSKRHYFRSPRSYVIYECATPTGDQCMLVRGLGVEQNCKFQRFVFEGNFDLSDFTEELENGTSVIVDFETLRKRLAGRELSEVKNSQLWEVLASKAAKSSKDLPRLGILPIKERSEYVSFRDVYVRLLALSNANAKQLRKLLVKCYAREIGEQKIDVATEYQEPFDRAERTERQVRFLSSVVTQIDEAQNCSDKIEDARSTLATDLPDVVSFLAQLRMHSRVIAANLQVEQNKLSAKRNELDDAIESDQGELVDAKVELRERVDKLKKLDSLHEKWKSTSPEMIVEMRNRQKETTNRIGKLKFSLDSTENENRDAIQRTGKRLTREKEKLQQTLENWEELFGSFLLEQGMSKAELDSVFRLLNPGTLLLPVGSDVLVKDHEELFKRFRTIANRVKKAVYSDETVKVDLSSFDPSIEELENRDLVVERLSQTNKALSQNTEHQEIVQQREGKVQELADLQAEWQERADELKEYDGYRDAWKIRSQLQQLVDEQSDICDAFQNSIKANRKALKGIDKTAKRIESDSRKCEEVNQRIGSYLADLRTKVFQVAIEMWPLDDTPEETDTNLPTLKTLQNRVGKIEFRGKELSEKLDASVTLRNRLCELANSVEMKSGEFDGQRVYFSEFDEQWNELFEQRSKLDELQQLAKRQWKLLFVPLSARLNDMLVAFRNVQNAVSNLNRRLGKHQVSNLRCLHVSVKPEDSTFAVVETLGSRDSLFHDPDKEEFARHRLRTMIDDGQVIDLENMFFLRIEVEKANGNRIVSNSLDEIGSTGTGTTAKAMIFVNLVRAIASDRNYKLHFYMDEIGDLDDPNLEAVTAMAVEQGVLPITANPHVKLEPLAHPEVTNYALGLSGGGQFVVDEGRTYRARRKAGLVVQHNYEVFSTAIIELNDSDDDVEQITKRLYDWWDAIERRSQEKK